MNKDWIKVLESWNELRETICEAVVPAEAGKHFRSSRREALLGVRAILDHTLERLDEHAGASSQEGMCSKHSKQSSHSIQITE
ncbi:hypothetical protein [Paenibacillus sp. SI8]|uniref:hypothetical protein n=1 Tax=unclassified Paenibacillus TaxID=185978 RepID=UPI003466E49D